MLELTFYLIGMCNKQKCSRFWGELCLKILENFGKLLKMLGKAANFFCKADVTLQLTNPIICLRKFCVWGREMNYVSVWIGKVWGTVRIFFAGKCSEKLRKLKAWNFWTVPIESSSLLRIKSTLQKIIYVARNIMLKTLFLNAWMEELQPNIIQTYLGVSWEDLPSKKAIIIHIYNLYLHTWQLSSYSMLFHDILCYFMVFYGILYIIDGLNNLPAIYLQFYDLYEACRWMWKII